MSTAHACALNDAIKRKLPVLINETGSLPQHLCKIACELNANYVSQRQESFWHRSAKYLTMSIPSKSAHMQFMPRKSLSHEELGITKPLLSMMQFKWLSSAGDGELI